MMANNATAYNSSLPSEALSLQFQCFKPMDVTVATMNTISFLINIFHLSVITRLETLKGTQYRTILINISLADLVNTLMVAVLYPCYDFSLFTILAGKPAMKIVINVVVNTANYIGYHIFLVASIQKYLAICRPTTYQSSPFVKRLPLVFAMAWIYVFLANTLFSLMKTLSPLLWLQSAHFRIVQIGFFSIPPNLITSILLIKVYRAMKVRKRKRQTMNARAVAQEKADKAAMYLIIIFTLEMIVFMLNGLSILIFYLTLMTVWGKIWNGFIKPPYTVANTVIYGWRTKAYQIHVRRMFGSRTSSVEPFEAS